MRKNDLCNELRREVGPKNTHGVAKVGDDKYRHIWFVVPPPPPTVSPKRLPRKALSKANRALNRLPLLDEGSELEHFVNFLFQRREALASSRMEGTWSTIDHILTPADHLRDELVKAGTASIRGYAEALEQNFRKALSVKYRVFTPTFVKTLHKLIMSKDGSFTGTPGSLRSPGKHSSIVFIGGFRVENSVFNPTPPHHVKRCLAETLSWYRNELLAESGDAGINGMTLPVRIAIGHAHFEAVHPFQDGNGRVGRMLWPFQFLLSGYSPLYLSGYVEAEKDAYISALEPAQKKLDYGPLIEFISEAIAESFIETESTKQVLLALPAKWRNKAKLRNGSAADRALPFLIKSPITTANELKETLDISFQAASTALKSLEQHGILNERTGFGRNRIFAAEDVLKLLARPFGEAP